MTTRPLHTTEDRIEDYARIAEDVLGSFSIDVQRLRESNRAAHANPRVRDEELAQRLEVESWVDLQVQTLRDALYLLAVGDLGATAVAAADPEQASKQAHDQRRRAAVERLAERGLI